MTIKFYLFLLTVSIFLHSCKEEESKFSGCCKQPAINVTVGNGHVYLSNIFTPNGDGINDYFTVYADSNIVIIRNMVIRSVDKIVFTTSNISPNNPVKGWDGRVNSKVVEGLYSVMAEIEASDGSVGIVAGKVCNHPCNDTGENILNAESCQFPSQNNDGWFNETLPSGESDFCFE